MPAYTRLVIHYSLILFVQTCDSNAKSAFCTPNAPIVVTGTSMLVCMSVFV